LNPTVKKVLAGLAVTKGIEKIQEIRQPRKSFLRRNLGKLLFVGVAGGIAAYLYKSGRVEQLVGGSENGYRDEFPSATPPAPGTQPIPATEDRPLEPSGV
jgi:hypothetical protein